MTTETILKDEQVICPKCAHQFRAISVQVQDLLLAAGYKPPFMQSELGATAPEIQALRKDAERYRHIRGGKQWVVAATQTGFHVDGEHLDDLVDSEMERKE